METSWSPWITLTHPSGNKYFMHRYKVNKLLSNWLNVGRPIIILYEKGESITRYVIFISLAWSYFPKVILKVIYPFTFTCYSKNPISNPLKGFRSSGARQSLSKASKYNMSGELPWSTITLLISHFSHLTVKTMWLSLWGWVPAASFFEKATKASGA